MEIRFANYIPATKNIGDLAQAYALDYIYARMNITSSEIVYFTYENLESRIEPNAHYILPMVMANVFYIPLIEHLIKLKMIDRFSFIPISLALTGIEFRNEKSLSKFRHVIDRFEMPIGCREHDTAELYQNLGYSAYVNGCITNTLPLRDDTTLGGGGGRRSAESRDKVYIIDAPDTIKEYMPKELYDKAVFLSQIIDKPIPAEQLYQLTQERYKLLRDTARLVISYRYHIATPCCAMGIPVIMLENCYEKFHWTFDVRFSALNPNIPFYTKENWEDIDWDPAPVEFEDQKKDMCELIISRIKNAACVAAMKHKIGLFYAPSKRRFWEIIKYNRKKVDIFAFLTNLDEPFLTRIKGEFRYYLYGLSDYYVKEDRCLLLEYIQRHYPRAEFLGFVDMKKTGRFMDKDILPPAQMKIDKQTYCLVSAYTANGYVAKLFDEKGWDKTHLWLMPRSLLFAAYRL